MLNKNIIKKLNNISNTNKVFEVKIASNNWLLESETGLYYKDVDHNLATKYLFISALNDASDSVELAHKYINDNTVRIYSDSTMDINLYILATTDVSLVQNQINDDIVSSGKTWSSEKINNELETIDNKSKNIFPLINYKTSTETDWNNAILRAIEDAKKYGGTIILPSEYINYSIDIIIPQGVNVQGTVNPQLFTTNSNKGCTLAYEGTGVAFQIGEDTGVGVKSMNFSNFSIEDKNGTGKIGLKIGGDNTTNFTSDINLESIHIKGFDTNIQVSKTYGLTCNLVVGLVARENGWHFKAFDGSLTASTFTSCGGYNCGNYGWFIERNISYSSFINCYFDGCKYGVYMTGYSRSKNIFENFGCEHYTVCGMEFNNQLFIGGINNPILIPKTENGVIVSTVKSHIELRVSRFSLNNTNIPSSYKLTSGYDINCIDGEVILNNVHCNNIKGRYRGNLVPDFCLISNPERGFNEDVEFIDVSTNNIIDIRNKHSIAVSSKTDLKSISFSQQQKGQRIRIYGTSDVNKIYLDPIKFPCLKSPIMLGEGDFIEMIYENLKGDQEEWNIVNINRNRINVEDFPSSGAWDRGRIFYYKEPSFKGYIGFVCVKQGFATDGNIFKNFGPLEL